MIYVADMRLGCRHEWIMPSFIVRTTNSVLFTETRYEDLPGPDEALSAGVHGAAMIASDEIANGHPAAAVEVSVEDEAGNMVRRSALSISVASLAIGSFERRQPPYAANED